MQIECSLRNGAQEKSDATPKLSAVPHTGDLHLENSSPGQLTGPRRPIIFAALLTGLAGFLDAIGYVQLNHLYVSFMSGNSTHLGIALATAAWPEVLAVIGIVSAFVAGACLGTRIADATNGHPLAPVLGGEAAILLMAVCLAGAGHDRLALAFVAVTMGMQNTLQQVVAGVEIGRGFITGTLFSLGQSIARLRHDRTELLRLASNALCWLAFVAGAVSGTLALAAFALEDCLVAATAAVLAVIAATFSGWL